MSYIKVGTYAPDGTDDYAITGIGFQPEFVLTTRVGTNLAVIAHKDMAAGASFEWSSTAAALADGIKSLDADGFTLGTNAQVNAAATTFYYVAIRGGDGIQLGSYVGAGASGKAVTGVGFQPTAVWVKCCTGTVRVGAFGTANGTADNYSFLTNNTTGPTPTHLKTLDADGFTALGSSNPWNTSGGTHVYVAFKGGTNVFYEGKYTGDGSSPRDVAGAGFTPTWGMSHTSGAVHKYARHTALPATQSKPIANIGVGTTQVIAFHAGGITVQSSVNAGGTTYYWMALRDSPPMPSVTTGLGALNFSGYVQSLALPAPVLGLPRELRFTGHAPTPNRTAVAEGLLSAALAAALR